jgi:hypothetical protein
VNDLKDFTECTLPYNFEQSEVFKRSIFFVGLLENYLGWQVGNALFHFFLFVSIRIFFLGIMSKIIIGSVLLVSKSLALIVVHQLQDLACLVIFFQKVTLSESEVRRWRSVLAGKFVFFSGGEAF